ncbi:MAG: HlyD family efflux transporter periplasmic adaptor subunit [Woeseiaceae bacterium]|nr:HlyD family efflux transporter periplasmic adaptor subunit [Woeseiaceae bacterium]
MSQPLFRDEAVRSRTDRVFGRPGLAAPVSHRVLSALSAGVAILVAGVLFLGQYTRKDTVPGFVTTTSGNVRVYAPRAGTVTNVAVTDGGEVTRGQLLVSMSVGRASAGTTAEAQMLTALRDELESVDVQMEQAGRIHAARVAAKERHLAATRVQQSLLARQLAVAGERLALREAELERLTAIAAQGHLAPADVQRARASYLDDALAYTTLEREQARSAAALSTLADELGELPLVFEQQQAVLDAARQQLLQRLADARGNNAIAITAPVNGRISGLRARIGDTLVPGRPVLTLLPNDARYYVELLVPSRAIGFIRTGAPVELRVDAYPHQKYGALHGTVAAISGTVVQPADYPVPIAAHVPSFVVKVSLESQAIDAHGLSLPLQAGMTVLADVERDRRRIIEWILAPVISAGRRIQ